MASSSKLVTLFFFAVAVAAAATLPPSKAARVQALPPDSAPAPPQSVLPASREQPTACLTPLLPLMPCMDYLTNITVFSPTTECCDGFRSVIKDAPICLCHGLNGDMNRFMRNPIDPIRMVTIQLACETIVPIDTLLGCANLSL